MLWCLAEALPAGGTPASKKRWPLDGGLCKKLHVHNERSKNKTGFPTDTVSPHSVVEMTTEE